MGCRKKLDIGENAMLNNELADIVSNLLVTCFKEGGAPTRKFIVTMVKKHHAHLNHPKLDLEIGLALNRLVDRETLQRVKGKFYAPGSRYGEES
jgi:hypothetical protein